MKDTIAGEELQAKLDAVRRSPAFASAGPFNVLSAAERVREQQRQIAFDELMAEVIRRGIRRFEGGV